VLLEEVLLAAVTLTPEQLELTWKLTRWDYCLRHKQGALA
jgi:hypothetical protein